MALSTPAALSDATRTATVTSPAAPRHESATHWMAHQAVVLVRPIFLLFLGATVPLMMTVWPAAIATGLIAVFLGTVLIVGREVEEHTEAGPVAERRGVAAETLGSAEPDGDAIDDGDASIIPGGTMDGRILRRETRTVIGIVVGLVALAALLAPWMGNRPMLGIGMAIVIVYGALVTFPMWAAWIEGDAEEEAARLDAE